MRFKKIPVLFGFCVFAIYTWLAFRSTGYDWAVTEIFSEVLSTASKQESGFPGFSYFYNGGIYLAHDPQAWVMSPLFQIFTALTGNVAAGRWLGVAYGVLGYFVTYAWLRTRFSQYSSVFGALALSLSLGMFWRMVGGHMLFVLQIFLPFFLLAITRIEDAGTAARKRFWIILMALAGAWMIYEPGFHALFYFIIPGLLIEMAVRFLIRPKDTFKLLLPLACSAVFSGLMILPKLLAWKSLNMSRASDVTDGTLTFKDVLVALFMTARSTVMGFHVPGSNPERWHFIFEVNTALMPIASILALVGIGFGIKCKWYREKNFLLAVVCLVFALLVASNQPFWEFIQALTPGGIRVPSRFIALGTFGLMIFSVYGIEKCGKTSAIVGSVLILVLAGNWLYRAQKSGTLRTEPLAMKDPRVGDPRFMLEKYCPVGSGCLNTYQVGYSDDPYIQYLAANKITEENLASHLPTKLEVRHTSLTLNSLKAGAIVDLPLRFASFGHRVSTVPPGLRPVVEVFQGHLRIHGDPLSEIQQLEIRPELPWPVWSVWVAAITGLISLIALGIPLRDV